MNKAELPALKIGLPEAGRNLKQIGLREALYPLVYSKDSNIETKDYLYPVVSIVYNFTEQETWYSIWMILEILTEYTFGVVKGSRSILCKIQSYPPFFFPP